MTSVAHWLVAYDIADPRRLARVHRHLVGRGIALQHSVFLIRLDESGLRSLLSELGQRIDGRRDDVRAYRLRRTGRPIVIGRDLISEGIHVADVVAARMVPAKEPRAAGPGR